MPWHANIGMWWGWQWVFPQHRRWQDPIPGREGGHHLDASLIQTSVRCALLAAGISKPASCQSLRHSFAPQLLVWGQDIRTLCTCSIVGQWVLPSRQISCRDVKKSCRRYQIRIKSPCTYRPIHQTRCTACHFERVPCLPSAA